MKPISESPLKGDEKYETIKYLGGGTYGEVWLARNRKTNEQVAIKFMPRGPDNVTKNVLRELLTHSSFCHPHVVLFKEVFLTPGNLAIALEYAPGGDLYQYVCSKGQLSEREARRIMQQIVVALDYCHQMGVVNRDVKLENALLDETKQLVKLTDFGFAKGPEDSLPKSNVGTPNYAAPEVIKALQGQYDGTLADVWSCGVLLYVLLFHCYPFERPDDPPGPAAFKLIVSRTSVADYVIPKKSKVSEECKDFLRQCLTPDPNRRISVQQIYDHPWFAKDFPAQARNLNADCLRRRANSAQQSKMQADIKTIIQMARRVPGQPKKPSGFDLDKDLDRQISEMMSDATDYSP